MGWRVGLVLVFVVGVGGGCDDGPVCTYLNEDCACCTSEQRCCTHWPGMSCYPKDEPCPRACPGMRTWCPVTSRCLMEADDVFDAPFCGSAGYVECVACPLESQCGVGLCCGEGTTCWNDECCVLLPADAGIEDAGIEDAGAADAGLGDGGE